MIMPFSKESLRKEKAISEIISHSEVQSVFTVVPYSFLCQQRNEGWSRMGGGLIPFLLRKHIAFPPHAFQKVALK